MIQLKQSMTSQHEADNDRVFLTVFPGNFLENDYKIVDVSHCTWKHFPYKKYPGQRCIPCWGCWMIRPHQLWYTSPTPSDKSEHPTLFHCLHVYPALIESDIGLPATSWQYNTCFVPNHFKNVLTKNQERKKKKKVGISRNNQMELK